MITLNKQIDLTFSHMGLFDTESAWLHPTVTIDSYELIFVVEGRVNLYEGEEQYRLKRGELLLLEPNVEHGGLEESHGHTSFYWLHFYAQSDAPLPFPKRSVPPLHDAESFFRKTVHLSRMQPLQSELTLASFLLSLNEQREEGNKLAYEIDEYARIHARKGLNVATLAERFGYSADYLSRIYKKQFHTDLCAGIVRHRLALAHSLLLNTNDTVKEIALTCGFEEENHFIKFFKYHERMTPTQFRNRVFYIHMNDH